jgi:OmpA-OmpF porin, OOP family
MQYRRLGVVAALALSAGWSFPALAQDDDFGRLMAMDLNGLEGEIQSRYDAGLAASMDQAVIAANDPRYTWALEAKVQCGIALGFLKSSTRDETSIRNCDRAYRMMTYRPTPVRVAAPVAPPPPPPQIPAICNDEVAAIVFFEFDSADVSTEAGQTLDTVVTNIRTCAWRRLTIVGHTDQAGTDAYNVTLSQQRADAVQAALAGRGVSAAAMTVSAQGESRPRVVLADGTRSPQNRRVEISAE